ncbi:MAG TPA: hypothetical protein VN798_09825 [Pseudomonas sp.]|nr:hypothetical protein [Pseudomonas sp.]
MELTGEFQAIYLYPSGTLLRQGAGTDSQPLSLGIHSLTGDALNTFIPLEKLDDINLEDYFEVWLTNSERWPQDPEIDKRECLWRSRRVLTGDVEIDAAFFQNLAKLWLKVDDLQDKAAVKIIEDALIARLGELQIAGDFFPGETQRVPSEDKHTDLRS